MATDILEQLILPGKISLDDQLWRNIPFSVVIFKRIQSQMNDSINEIDYWRNVVMECSSSLILFWIVWAVSDFATSLKVVFGNSGTSSLTISYYCYEGFLYYESRGIFLVIPNLRELFSSWWHNYAMATLPVE